MPKAESNNVLSCGCVRNGRSCAEAQRLWQEVQEAYGKITHQGGSKANKAFRDASEIYVKHRKGKG